MEILQYILLGVLLICGLFIVIAVLLQKSKDEGLSQTIAGGADTFYGRDGGNHRERTLKKWTLVAGVIFVVAVIAIYVIQPDYALTYPLDHWKELSGNKSVFS